MVILQIIKFKFRFNLEIVEALYFDMEGNLVGVTTSSVNRTLDLTENVNYAVKSSYIVNLVDVLSEKNKST